MDLVLDVADEFALDHLWARLVPLDHPFANQSILTVDASTTALQPQSAWPRDYVPRQLLSLFMLTLIGIHLVYFTFAGLSFQFMFNHDLMRHPRFLKNQIKLEIQTCLISFPVTTLLMLPWFQGQVMGYSRLYDDVSEYGWLYFVFSIPLFFVFTEFLEYWAHRTMHHPMLYKYLHKPHHKFIIPTPFASHAFHPVDTYIMSTPYLLFVFVFPFHRGLYLVLFALINLWIIFVHDSDMITGHPLEWIINGPSHHTLHHLNPTVNYGQYFTWADRMGGSYRRPESHLNPLLEVAKQKAL